MAESAFPLITIRPCDPQTPLTAFNAEILLDGKPLHGVKRIEFVLDSEDQDRLECVKLFLYAGVEIDGAVGELIEMKSTPGKET